MRLSVVFLLVALTTAQSRRQDEVCTTGLSKLKRGAGLALPLHCGVQLRTFCLWKELAANSGAQEDLLRLPVSALAIESVPVELLANVGCWGTWNDAVSQYNCRLVKWQSKPGTSSLR